MTKHLTLLMFLLAPFPVHAGESGWFLLSRDDGCVDLRLLVKREKLPRTPASPEEYAQMLRDRGESVTLGLPDGVPPELAPKVVQVKTGESKAPVFVTGDICRSLDK